MRSWLAVKTRIFGPNVAGLAECWLVDSLITRWSVYAVLVLPAVSAMLAVLIEPFSSLELFRTHS